MDKRTFIKSVFLGSAGLILSARAFKVKAPQAKKSGTENLSFLNWDLHIALWNRIWMHIHCVLHHNRNTRAYTEKFNAAVKEGRVDRENGF